MRGAWLLLAASGCALLPAELRPGSPDEPAGKPAAPDEPTVTPPAPDVPTQCEGGPLLVTGGAGRDAFAPLADGDVVTLVTGPRGGFWIDTALRVQRTTGQVLVFPTVTLVATGQVVSGIQGRYDTNNVYIPLVATGDCRGEAWGLRAYLNDFAPTEPPYDNGPVWMEEICALAGQTARIDWTVTDLVNERVGEASVEVVLESDPIDVERCAELAADTSAP